MATLFGLGFYSKVPGTLGTIAAIPLWYGLSHLHPITYMAATLVLVVVGMLVSSVYVNTTGKEDPSEVIIDETVAFLIAMAWLPRHWIYVLLAFVLFRALDIVKPFPISVMDRKIKGGVGVMADDIAAGIVTNVILQMIFQQGLL